MSLLPSATFAGPSQAEALWAVAGSTGPGGGVTQLVAGPNITLNPPTGEGVVTISASGGSGGVTSVTASGAGITATPTSGAVVVANTGVTSIVAGTNVTVSGASGAVTINSLAATTPTVNSATLPSGGGTLPDGVNGCIVTGAFSPSTGNPAFYIANVRGQFWGPNDIYCVTLKQYYLSALSATPAVPPPQNFQATWDGTGLNIQLIGTNLAITHNAADTAPVFYVLRVAGL